MASESSFIPELYAWQEVRQSTMLDILVTWQDNVQNVTPEAVCKVVHTKSHKCKLHELVE